jgi:hypothetical protein
MAETNSSPQNSQEEGARLAVSFGRGPHGLERSADLQRLRDYIAAMVGTDGLELGDPLRIRNARECEWLQVIYESHREQLQNDQERGWVILQLFTPLSLAPFVAIVAVPSVELVHVVVLALASTMLLLVSNLIIDRLGWFAYRSKSWTDAIEAEVGLPMLAVTPNLQHKPRYSILRFGFRTIRWMLFAGVILMWVVLALLVWAGYLAGVSA